MTIAIPYVTEKTLSLSEKGWFAMTAPKTASKVDVKNYVKAQYGITAESIRSSVRKGEVRRKGKHTFTTGITKLFYVKLPEGKKLPGFEIK